MLGLQFVYFLYFFIFLKPSKELYRDEGETFCLSLYMPALRALFYGAVSGLSGLSGSKPCFPIFYFNFFFFKNKKSELDPDNPYSRLYMPVVQGAGGCFCIEMKRVGASIHKLVSIHAHYHLYKGQFCIEFCISSYMKRLNETTGQPFKRGDVREDGFVFYNYTGQVKSDGFFMERWLSPDTSEKTKSKDRVAKKSKYQRKTNRKSPGFDALPSRVQATIHQIIKVHEDQVANQDLSLDDMADMLMGYELEPEELSVAIAYAQPICFDAREVFRKVMSE